jgi:serpin B
LPFLDTLASYYGAGVRLTDFGADPEAARHTINGWVATQTEQRIPELLSKGVINVDTRLVLVNATYFNAAWAQPFGANSTQATTFHGRSGDVPVQMMSASLDEVPYAVGIGWQAVSLPYAGEQLSFIAVLPDDLDAFEASFNADQAQNLMSSNHGPSPTVNVKLPKFEIDGASFRLKDALETRGMRDAFDSDKANFAGVSSDSIYLADVVHNAFVSVDENGTEAAAATGVVGGFVSSNGLVTLTFDRPFLFFIRDRATGAILFLGRVVSP